VVNSSLFLRISFWLNYTVFRWQFLLTLLALWLSGLWLKSRYGQDDSSMWLVINQFLVIIRWSVIGLFALSVVMAALSWLFFLYSLAAKRIGIQVDLGDGQRAEAGLVPVTIVLRGTVIRPLLGTIRARLIFTGKGMSDVITLDTNVVQKGRWIRHGIRGTGRTMLHDRGIYDVEKVHILFFDMFNLVALPWSIPFLHQVYTLPRIEQPSKVKAQPNAVEEQKFRIDVPKRVEGEYINYKEFESGDNIRRIVWKIYAKSGQLVVRIPETRDPYASHLYFYSSYFQDVGLQGGIFDQELLNVYKDKIRNLLEALERNGYDVNLPSDQEIPKLAGVSDKKNELFQITAARWQSDMPPSVFVKPLKAAFVCLSSLTPAAEVDRLIRLLPLNVPMLVVKLSDAIPSPFKIATRDLFFRPENNPVDRLRKPWLIAPLRRTLQRNESEIEALFSQRGNGWVTNRIDISA
jgi:hypothetical protein